MAGDSQLPNIGGNGFVWILVAMATTYFVAHPGPLSGSRPASTDRSLSEHIGEQRIDARLWQDPFAVVADDLQNRSSNRRAATARTVTEGHRNVLSATLGKTKRQAGPHPCSLSFRSTLRRRPRGTPAPALRGTRGIGRRGMSRRTRNTLVSTGPISPSLRSKDPSRPLTGQCFDTSPPPRNPQPPREALRLFPTNGSSRGPSVPMSKRNTSKSCSSGSMRTFSLHQRSNRCRQNRSSQK